MASVGFGSTVAAVAPASSSAAGRGRPRRSLLAVPAATRGSPAPAKKEKSLGDFIFGSIFKKDQLVETDPLLNKVEATGTTAGSRAKGRSGTTAGGKKPASSDDGGSGGGFSLAGLFDRKG